ncbi:hypothetical protein M5K25_008649 [Dendrobium thyrsiflorum]|uniref:DUF4283 domain-containing protein n=1 Tax=Dendrobium thyrsiflorum TaxID=117978 RepID=A0ABD0V997_DENTH
MAVNRVDDPGFLENKFKSRSFRDALSGVSSSSEFPELKLSSCHGLPTLWISDEEMRDLAVPFEFALVGKFPGRRPSLEAIRKIFFLLKLSGNFSVTLLNSKNILVKFVNDLDYCRVFSHRSYFVSFLNLRPHLFTVRILFGLGSLFGRPLRTDNATSTGLRPSVARVLVELDVKKKYSNFVWIGSETLGYRQRVELEDFPSYCDRCKVLGHSNVECCVLSPSLANSSFPCEDGVVKAVGGNIALVDPVVVDLSGNSNEGVVPDVTSVPGNNVNVNGLKDSLVEDAQCIELLEPGDVGNPSVLFNLVEVHEDVVFNSGGGFKTSYFFSPAAVGEGGSEALVVDDIVDEGFRVEPDIVSAQTDNVDNLIDVPISVLSPTGFHKLVVSNIGVTCSGNSVWSEGYPSAGEGEGDLEEDNHDSLLDLYGLDVCKVTEKALSHGKKRCRRKSRRYSLFIYS